MSNDSLVQLLILLAGVIGIIVFILIFVWFIIRSKEKRAEREKQDEEYEKTHVKKSQVIYTPESIIDFMDFDKIEDNMIIQKKGKFLMIVECQGINYDLMSEMEKVSVEQGFIAFLNTLRYPVQLYVQTRTINLERSVDGYKTKLREIERSFYNIQSQYESLLKSNTATDEQIDRTKYELVKQKNLKEYTEDIIRDIERQSLNRSILSKKYYIVIPYYTSELGQNDFDKGEKKNLAFSELYTRAQSIIRTLSVCGINAGILDSNGLVDLLYVAYNRDDAEVYGLDKALKAGYDELYSTAPDVLDKKMRALDAKITQEAFVKANNAVVEAKSKKQKALERKENRMDDLIEQMAQLIIDENRAAIGNKVADEAQDVIKEERARRKGRPRKEEGGTKENEQKEQTSKKWVKRTT